MGLSLRIPILCRLSAAQACSQPTGEPLALAVSFLAHVHSYEIHHRAEERDTVTDMGAAMNFSISCHNVAFG